MFLVSKFYVLGTKFCILESKFCILATKLEILIKYNFRHYLEIQIPSLPQNTNIVTTSKSKLPQNPNFLTASESKFGSITKTENSIEIVKFRSKNSKFIPKINKFRSKNKNFDPKMQNTKFRF